LDTFFTLAVTLSLNFAAVLCGGIALMDLLAPVFAGSGNVPAPEILALVIAGGYVTLIRRLQLRRG
jgi:hypothetical protein